MPQLTHRPLLSPLRAIDNDKWDEQQQAASDAEVCGCAEAADRSVLRLRLNFAGSQDSETPLSRHRTR